MTNPAAPTPVAPAAVPPASVTPATPPVATPPVATPPAAATTPPTPPAPAPAATTPPTPPTPPAPPYVGYPAKFNATAEEVVAARTSAKQAELNAERVRRKRVAAEGNPLQQARNHMSA